MKIELKRFQHFARMSEETIAYDADIWIDGVKADPTPQMIDAVAARNPECIILNNNPKLAMEVLT